MADRTHFPLRRLADQLLDSGPEHLRRFLGDTSRGGSFVIPRLGRGPARLQLGGKRLEPVSYQAATDGFQKADFQEQSRHVAELPQRQRLAGR